MQTKQKMQAKGAARGAAAEGGRGDPASAPDSARGGQGERPPNLHGVKEVGWRTCCFACFLLVCCLCQGWLFVFGGGGLGGEGWGGGVLMSCMAAVVLP